VTFSRYFSSLTVSVNVIFNRRVNVVVVVVVVVVVDAVNVVNVMIKCRGTQSYWYQWFVPDTGLRERRSFQTLSFVHDVYATLTKQEYRTIRIYVLETAKRYALQYTSQNALFIVYSRVGIFLPTTIR